MPFDFNAGKRALVDDIKTAAGLVKKVLIGPETPKYIDDPQNKVTVSRASMRGRELVLEQKEKELNLVEREQAVRAKQEKFRGKTQSFDDYYRNFPL